MAAVMVDLVTTPPLIAWTRAQLDDTEPWDPARALGLILAIRKIIAEYEAAWEFVRDHPRRSAAEADGLYTAIKILAAALYADRPGYREEWRP